MDDYIRLARLNRVIDGDTLEMDIDLGFGIWLKKKRLRVLGVNCPEKKADTMNAWRNATKFTIDWFGRYGSEIFIKTYLDRTDQDSFGRVLADVQSISGKSLAGDLVESSNAVTYIYRASYGVVVREEKPS